MTDEQEKPRQIVAEVSCNWPSETNVLISKKFERVIEVNRQRGYVLSSWQLERLFIFDPTGKTAINETIVAVFNLERQSK